MLAAGSRIGTAHRRRRLGQHFLSDPSAVRRIVAAIPFLPGDGCLEIGPGRGALTFALLERVAFFAALEVDAGLASALEARLANHPRQPRIVVADALTAPLEPILDGLRQRGARRVQVCGNLPYSVATPLLIRLLGHADRFAGCTFMVQKEVADRILARPGSSDYGLLSVIVALRADACHYFDLGPSSFSPRPKVHSSLIGLRPLAADPLDERAGAAALGLARAAFAHRRKTLVNSVRAEGGPWRACEAGLATLGHSPNARAQDLGAPDYVRLAALLPGPVA